MSFEQLLFYGFSVVLVATCLMVIILKNSVRCALFLVAAFITTAALWLLLEAEFLALILVLVYVGAVMTLFLFVVMMMNVEVESVKDGFVKYFPVVLLIVALLVSIMVLIIGPDRFGLASVIPSKHAADYSNVKDLGSVLYTQYALQFEVAGVLLLVAIVSAITLSFRGPQNRLKQNVVNQVRVKKEDRVRIVKMKVEDLS